MNLNPTEKNILLASLERNKLRNKPFDYSEELEILIQKIQECEP